MKQDVLKEEDLYFAREEGNLQSMSSIMGLCESKQNLQATPQSCQDLIQQAKLNASMHKIKNALRAV